jgi:prepilin-type N-terminal cleavage/methylation domain-containing protein
MWTNAARSRGFTLVEILVVIAIVATLSTIVISNMSGSRKKSNDTQRKSDIAEIQLALRLYKDATGSYPSGYDTGTTVGTGGSFDSLLSPYLPTVPKDPLNAADPTFTYFYDTKFRCMTDNQFHIVLFAAKTQSPGVANFGVHPNPNGICKPAGAMNDSNEGNPNVTTYGVILQ